MVPAIQYSPPSDVELSREPRRVQHMFASISKRYDIANSVLSMGIHHLWRRALVRAMANTAGGRVLDLCTGTGDLLPLLSRRFKRVVGVDFCAPMLEKALPKIAEAKVDSSVRLLQGDGLRLPFADGSFDAVTVAFGVRNFLDTREGLREIRRVLRQGGELFVIEFGQPKFAPVRWGFSLYSKYLMPLIGAVLTGNRAAYTYLPKTAATFPCAQDFTAIMKECGYERASFSSLSFGIAYLYRGA